MRTYSEVSRICEENGFSDFGVTTALPFFSAAKYLKDLPNILSGLCETEIKKRIYPDLTMEGAKSILCFLFPYIGRKDIDTDGFDPKKAQGVISSGDVWLGMDYHVYVKNRLSGLCFLLSSELNGSFMPFCDTGPLIDKEVAVRAGLCKYGRNSLAINEKYGSYFYIGYILSDIGIEDASMSDISELSERCLSCRNCVDACPTGALSVGRVFNHERCVSYISQKKGVLTPEEARCLGNALYGCLICQSVCPANEEADFKKYVDIDPGISNSVFKRLIGDTAAGFIGKTRFVRNSRAVLENMKEADNGLLEHKRSERQHI